MSSRLGHIIGGLESGVERHTHGSHSQNSTDCIVAVYKPGPRFKYSAVDPSPSLAKKDGVTGILNAHAFMNDSVGSGFG